MRGSARWWRCASWRMRPNRATPTATRRATSRCAPPAGPGGNAPRPTARLERQMDSHESDENIVLIREAVVAVCRKFDDDYWSACETDHRFPDEFYAEMARGGWIGIAIPEAYGGGGQGIR